MILLHWPKSCLYWMLQVTLFYGTERLFHQAGCVCGSYEHTHTHKYTQKHTNTHKYTQKHTNTHAYKHTHTHTHTHIQTHTSKHIHTHTNTLLLAYWLKPPYQGEMTVTIPVQQKSYCIGCTLQLFLITIPG
jgi:ABC-type nickel/cobalt efflux system permease component RcnA